MSVSYTHLDVYKRQDPDRARHRLYPDAAPGCGLKCPRHGPTSRPKVTAGPPARLAVVDGDIGLAGGRCLDLAWRTPVSYTHLDVYKRQGRNGLWFYTVTSRHGQRKNRLCLLRLRRRQPQVAGQMPQLQRLEHLD